MNNKVILTFFGLLSTTFNVCCKFMSVTPMQIQFCKMLKLNEDCVLFMEKLKSDSILDISDLNLSDEQHSIGFPDTQKTLREIFGLPPANATAHYSNSTEPAQVMDINSTLQNTRRFDTKAENFTSNVNDTGEDYRFQTSDVIESRFRGMLQIDKEIDTISNDKILSTNLNTRKGMINTRTETNKSSRSLHVTKIPLLVLCMFVAATLYVKICVHDNLA